MKKRLVHLLSAIGAGLLAWCAWSVFDSHVYQSSNLGRFERFSNHDRLENSTVRRAGSGALSASRPGVFPEGTAVGLLQIPRIGVSAVIAEGDGEATLRRAVGHIPGTALPGRNGNVGLAGHRDGFFRPLAGIRLHDEIRLTIEGGRISQYRVESTAVVEPTDVRVLDPGPRSSLTLITCYPFQFLGSAPKRFVVTAVLVSTEDSRVSRLAAP